MGSLTSHFGNCPAQADGRAGGGGRGGAAGACDGVPGRGGPPSPMALPPHSPQLRGAPIPPGGGPSSGHRRLRDVLHCPLFFVNSPEARRQKCGSRPTISHLAAPRSPRAGQLRLRCTRKAGNRGVNPSQHGENAAAPTGAGLWAGCAKRKQGPLSKTRPGYRRGRLSKVRKALAQFFRGKKTKNLSRTFFF
jgi:hypothetical protein